MDSNIVVIVILFLLVVGAIWSLLPKPKVDPLNPECRGWTPEDLLLALLEQRQAQYENGKYGPFTVVFGRKWSRYLNNDYYSYRGVVMQCPRLYFNAFRKSKALRKLK